MVIRAHLDAMTVSRIRWTLSPVFEMVSWLALTAVGRRHPLLGDPGAAARLVLHDPEVAATAALITAGLAGGYTPDFATPKPDPDSGTPGAQLRSQLERIRGTPPDQLERQLDWMRTSGFPVPATEPAALPKVVAGGLMKFWRFTMAEQWDVTRTQLLEQQEHHIRAAVRVGIGPVLNSLHSSVRWRDGCLEIDNRYAEQLHYHDSEIVLVPSLVAWPRPRVQLCDPAEAVVAYPVAGAAGRLRPPAEALLGRGRSRVLQQTGTAISTTDLSRQLQLAPSTVSHHLAVLLDSGLVSRTRRGRSVLYYRTDAGQRLLEAAVRKASASGIDVASRGRTAATQTSRAFSTGRR